MSSSQNAKTGWRQPCPTYKLTSYHSIGLVGSRNRAGVSLFRILALDYVKHDYNYPDPLRPEDMIHSMRNDQ
jgi:hypothetical protein